MSTAIVLFGRDLRVADHPALALAAASVSSVIPLFVLDDADLVFGANGAAMLVACLADLDRSLAGAGRRAGDSPW